MPVYPEMCLHPPLSKGHSVPIQMLHGGEFAAAAMLATASHREGRRPFHTPRAIQPSKLALRATGKTVRYPFLTWDPNKQEEPTGDRTLPVRLDTAQVTNTQPDCSSQQVVRYRGKL